MKVELNEIPIMTLDEFADTHGFIIEIYERRVKIGDPMRYWAKFKRTETKGGGVLTGEYGNGATPEEAMENYAKKIQLTTLVYGAYAADRKVIKVPRLKCR